MFIQSSLFNDDTYRIVSVYIKWQQVKTEWGVSGEREGEGERENRDMD